MKKKFRNYQEKLHSDLQDLELANHYLNEAFADKDPRLFLLAIKNVYEAHKEKINEDS